MSFVLSKNSGIPAKYQIEGYVDSENEIQTLKTNFGLGSKIKVVGNGKVYILMENGWTYMPSIEEGLDDYYTKEETEELIRQAALTRFLAVEELPITNIQTNVIYLVPKNPGDTGNIKEEYINLDGTTAGWEKIGDTEIDLDGYIPNEGNTTLDNLVIKRNTLYLGNNAEDDSYLHIVNDNGGVVHLKSPYRTWIMGGDAVVDLRDYILLRPGPNQKAYYGNDSQGLKNEMEIATIGNLSTKLDKAGGQLTGQLTTTQTSFTEDQQLVTKKYVDDNAGTVDNELDVTSENPVQNKVIAEKVEDIEADVLRAFAEIDALAMLTTNLSAYFALKRTGKVYQVKVWKFETNQTTVCVKQLDNEGLVAEPSTDTVEGRDDYLDIPVFQWWHCNYERDASGVALVTAIEGDNKYKISGTVDVGSLFMSRYRKWDDSNEQYSLLTISDSPHPELGLELMDVCKDKDGTDKGYGVFSAYHGLYSQPGIAPLLFVSHNTCLTQFQTKGAGYWGQTFEKLQFVYDNILLKYGDLGGKSSQNVFAGCSNYNYQYDAAYKDSESHTYFPLTTAQAANIEIGSWCAVGYASLNANTGALNKDRGQTTVRNKVENAKVLSKETITLDGTDYVAIYLDIPETAAFNTLDVDVSTETYPDTYSPIMISTMPWGSGSTDTVVGKHDGSLKSNTDSGHPFRIMGIECMIGAWEVVTDTVMYGDGNHNIQFYQAPFGVTRSNNTTTIQNTYRLAGTKGDISTATSYWIGNVTSPKGLFYPTTQGTGASVGCGDQNYSSWQNGWRECLLSGTLWLGSTAGCCHLSCSYGLTNAYWYVAASD